MIIIIICFMLLLLLLLLCVGIVTGYASALALGTWSLLSLLLLLLLLLLLFLLQYFCSFRPCSVTGLCLHCWPYWPCLLCLFCCLFLLPLGRDKRIIKHVRKQKVGKSQIRCIVRLENCRLSALIFFIFFCWVRNSETIIFVDPTNGVSL